jgi:hypothetical protein
MIGGSGLSSCRPQGCTAGAGAAAGDASPLRPWSPATSSVSAIISLGRVVGIAGLV